MKVFIADDSSIMCERLSSMLSDLPGLEVIGSAASAIDAACRIRELKPDAVILDIRMPEGSGSGIDVLSTIKNQQGPPLVIILTNYSYPQYRERCERLGADFFFEKSADFEKVFEVFEKLIEQCNASRGGQTA